MDDHAGPPAGTNTLCLSVSKGERIGIQRVGAVAVGLAGVLMIIRPGMSDFNL